MKSQWDIINLQTLHSLINTKRIINNNKHPSMEQHFATVFFIQSDFLKVENRNNSTNENSEVVIIISFIVFYLQYSWKKRLKIGVFFIFIY